MNLKDKLSAVENELRSIHTNAGDEALTDEAQARWDELSAERSQIKSAIAKDDERRAMALELASQPANVENGDGARSAPAVHVKRDPFEALEGRADKSALVDANLRAVENNIEGGDNQAHFERLVKRHAGDAGWARQILARSKPEYTSAWGKLVTGRSELLTVEERAAMAVGTDANGGYMVPTHLDPTLILTNSGSANVMRQHARVVTLTSGNVWNGVTTAGVTAGWVAEGDELTDNSPTVGREGVPLHSAKALVQASFEAVEDIDNLGQDILMLFADARDRLEGSAFMTGDGSGKPTGLFTAVAAVGGRVVPVDTAGTLAAEDLGNTYKHVGQRWRGASSWVMHPTINLAVKNLGTAVSAAFSGDLRLAPTDAILGRPVIESDDAPSAVGAPTTTENLLVFGDLKNYVIADKPGSTSVEYIPHMFGTTANLPNGNRGWVMYFRTGGAVVNDNAFALLQDGA